MNHSGLPSAPSSQASTSTPRTVQVRNASVIFQTADAPVQALDRIDLDINEGEFVALIGPSGCGKTTLMRVIADLEKISAGEVLVNGVTPHQARLARAYGYVFQAPALFPWRTVLAIAPIVLVILGSLGVAGVAPKAVIAMYLCFFPVTVAMVQGLRSPQRIETEMLHTYAATHWQAQWLLRLPASLPFLFPALRVGIAAGLVGAMVAELPTGVAC
jgi:ABC-type Fe3+/spermidine/putrescine transport system ATPase subunit